MDQKDVPICSDFALLFYEQEKQRKLVNSFCTQNRNAVLE